MDRKFNSDKNGKPYPNRIKLAVWNKGKVVQGHDPAIVRKDLCGAWIHWDKYGNTVENGNGWEIDHVKPVAMGGKDDLSNLQPLQWQNNRKKGDNYPTDSFCIISAKDW